VLEIKSRAEAIRVYTQQKDMGREAGAVGGDDIRVTDVRCGAVPAALYDADEPHAEKWGGSYGAEAYALPHDPSSTSSDVAGLGRL
jgi:hypothetical protein